MRCGACGHSDNLLDLVLDLKAWARSRIEQCRADELKFKASATSLEAARERMTLLAVLRQLETTPKDDKEPE